MSNFYRFVFTMMLAGFVIATLPASAQEGERDVSFDFQLDNASKWVWRGLIVNDEQVHQAKVTASMAGFSLGVRANYDLTDANIFRGKSSRFSRLDYSLSYGAQAEMIKYDFGVVYYDYLSSYMKDTAEVFGSIGLDTILNPTVTVYYDFVDVHGFYGTFAVGHSIPLNDAESFNLDLGASIGCADGDYMNYYWGNSSSFVDVVGSAGLSYAINDNIGVGVSLSYSELLRSSNRRASEAAFGDSDALWTTFSVKVGF